MGFDKSATALKCFQIPFGAAALSLLMAAWSPTATATTACSELRDALNAYYDSGQTSENPMKPTNVEVESAEAADGSITFTVSWDIPSNRPLATVTGRAIHLEHKATGYFISIVRSGSNTSADIDCPVSTSSCTGSFLAMAKLRNTCELFDFWSDSASYERSSE